jgi:hypothetical protein
MTEPTIDRTTIDWGRVIIFVTFLVSPLLSIFFHTLKAVYYTYNRDFVTDPGHRFAHRTDVGLICFAIIGTIVAYWLSGVINPINVFSVAANPLYYLLFASFSGWSSALLMYGISSCVYLYDIYRDSMIATINTRAGAW